MSWGQVGISIKDKSAYFDFEKLDFVYTWRKSWFYLKGQHVARQRFGLALFDPAARVAKQSSWSNSLSASELSVVNPLVQKISALKDNLTDGQLISLFVRRRVQPLQHECAPCGSTMDPWTRPGAQPRSLPLMNFWLGSSRLQMH